MDNINPKAIYSFIYFVFGFSCDEKHLEMEEKMISKKIKLQEKIRHLFINILFTI